MAGTVTAPRVIIRGNSDDDTIVISGNIVASEFIEIYGGGGNDTIVLTGTLSATEIRIYGEGGNDVITIDIDDLGGQALTGHVVVDGGAGDDSITVNELHTRTGVIDIDGGEGSEIYTVNTRSDATDYLINVFDTGTGLTDTDVIIVNGTVAADSFLLRASEHAYPAGVAFVASLHGDPVSTVERISYNKNIEHLTLNTGDSADTITLDDNWADTTIDGGAGNDIFQVGQMFKSERDAANANIAPDDEFETVLTTRGYLSNGVSYDTVIEGGEGDDKFTVFRNTADLSLKGGLGDDTFIVRAFALEGSHTTDLTGEGGADYVEYVINAPVHVNGGDGTDILKVIGTEFSDNIVVTDTGVYGMGLTVDYDEIENLEIDAAEGNDIFYVLSTNADVVTWLYGGLGSDRFSIAGDVPELMSGDEVIYPATDGTHTVDVIDGLLHIQGGEKIGSAGGLGTPVMLPGETNTMASTGDILEFTGTGTSASTDYMTVYTLDVRSS